MIVAWLYFFLSLLLTTAVVKLYCPKWGRGWIGTILSFMAMVLFLFEVPLVLAGFITTSLTFWMGGLGDPVGIIGLGLHLVCWTAVAMYLARTKSRSFLLNDQLLSAFDVQHPLRSPTPNTLLFEPRSVLWKPIFTFGIKEMREVELKKGIVYREVEGKKLRLDIYQHKGASTRQPAIVYIHGGAWVSGTRRQARFMCYQLAAAGWTVFAISYRLAPRFPLPAAIIDCKAAVGWIRQHAPEFNADPSTLIAIGGSAGGHLAAMLALAPNVPRFQPGFEATDTSIQGAVIFYGVLDFVSAFERHHNRAVADILERLVLKKRYVDDPELFRAISPTTYINQHCPPLLLIHGTNDKLVPVKESREFFRKLKEAGAPEVHLLEVPLGVHAFDLIPLPLYQHTMRVLAAFLEPLRNSQGSDSAQRICLPNADATSSTALSLV